jgi:hypothetical protein
MEYRKCQKEVKICGRNYKLKLHCYFKLKCDQEGLLRYKQHFELCRFPTFAAENSVNSKIGVTVTYGQLKGEKQLIFSADILKVKVLTLHLL